MQSGYKKWNVYAKRPFGNVVDVIDNVFAADGAYQYIMIVGKKKTHLLRVITDGAWRIMFCRKHIGKLPQSFLCLGG